MMRLFATTTPEAVLEIKKREAPEGDRIETAKVAVAVNSREE